MRKCKAPRREFAVGVRTSPSGADFWADGVPYRLHSVVAAPSLPEAAKRWLRVNGDERDACVSASAAHVEVVRLREEQLPARTC